MSSTNIGSILIFTSCVVGTCNILCGVSFLLRGVLFLNIYIYVLLFPIVMVSVGIYTLGGEF